MTRPKASSVAAFGVAVFGLFLPTSAQAWCRTTTNLEFLPTAGKPCDDEGLPLYWATRCLSFSVQRDASIQVSLETARTTLQDAFNLWSQVSCPADPVSCTGPAAGRPSIAVRDMGPVGCGCAEYNPTTGNANVIAFRDLGWTDCYGEEKPGFDVTLALTTVTFNKTTGEILDADMEVNSANNRMTTTSPPAKVLYDFPSIMAHETGHFLGLAHTQPVHKESTMLALYEKGQTFMRDLEVDDICGICAAYPPVRTEYCDAVPRRGLALECNGGDVAVSSKGCHCTIEQSPEPNAAVGLVAVVLIGMVEIRRKRRTSSTCLRR